MPDDEERGRDKVRAFKSVYLLSSIGIQLAVSILFGLGMGLALDQWLGAEPFFLLLFLGFGVAAGFLNVYRMAKKEIDSDKRDV